MGNVAYISTFRYAKYVPSFYSIKVTLKDPILKIKII